MNKDEMIKIIQSIANRSANLKPIIDNTIRDKGGFETMSEQDLNELYVYCINAQTK